MWRKQMSDANNSATPSPTPSAPQPRGFRPIVILGKLGRGMNLHSKEHHKRMLFLGSWDALIYAIAVAILVPVMGMEYFHIFFLIKLMIALLWFAFVPMIYWYIEVSEITAQIALNGILNTDQTEHQRRSMMLPYWGVTFAFVIWIVAKVSNGAYIDIRYGWIEWMILALTLLNTLLTINVLYPLVSNYLQATSSQRRFETESH
ncbi:MAG: hypothetical protein JWO50_214 [Candidatus Kaiserbacteria bacterium]|nr:hypothetical protein [Candidatus Kaiserbacteria bacterium]